MADNPVSTGIGTGAAQVWQTNATNQAFNKLLENKRLDEAAKNKKAAEEAKLKSAADAKKSEFIRNELKDYDPDMSKIFEAKDGDFLREEVNGGFIAMMSEPGFGKKLYDGDREAWGKFKEFKTNASASIIKSAKAKEDAKPYIDLVTRYRQAKEDGVMYEDPNFYMDDIERVDASMREPGTEIYVPTVKVDAIGNWHEYIKKENAAFDSRHARSVTHIKEDGSSYAGHGSNRSDEEIEEITANFWGEKKNARRMYHDLGIDFDKYSAGMAEGDPDQKKIDDFIDAREAEAIHDAKRTTVKDAPIKETPEAGSQEEFDAYNRIDEMAKVLQTIPQLGGEIIHQFKQKEGKSGKYKSSPEYNRFSYKSSGETYNHFDSSGVLSDYVLLEPSKIPVPSGGVSVENILSVMERSPNVRIASLVLSEESIKNKEFKGYSIAIVDSKGNASVISPSDYTSVAGTLADGEKITDWSLEKQDKMNKGKITFN